MIFPEVSVVPNFPFNCVWIPDVTPETYPSSVEVTEDALSTPEASEVIAREAVKVANLPNPIAALALMSASTIDPSANFVESTLPDAIVGLGYEPVRSPPADPPGVGLLHDNNPAPSVVRLCPAVPAEVGSVRV